MRGIWLNSVQEERGGWVPEWVPKWWPGPNWLTVVQEQGAAD